MCTKFIRNCSEKSVVAYKVIEVRLQTRRDSIGRPIKSAHAHSPFCYYGWKKGINNAIGAIDPLGRSIIHDGVFHCFPTIREAKRWIKYCNEKPISMPGHAIIRVKLSGNIIVGAHHNFCYSFDESPCICGSIATWDGRVLMNNKYMTLLQARNLMIKKAKKKNGH